MGEDVLLKGALEYINTHKARLRDRAPVGNQQGDGLYDTFLQFVGLKLAEFSSGNFQHELGEKFVDEFISCQKAKASPQIERAGRKHPADDDNRPTPPKRMKVEEMESVDIRDTRLSAALEQPVS